MAKRDYGLSDLWLKLWKFVLEPGWTWVCIWALSCVGCVLEFWRTGHSTCLWLLLAFACIAVNECILLAAAKEKRKEKAENEKVEQDISVPETVEEQKQQG